MCLLVVANMEAHLGNIIEDIIEIVGDISDNLIDLGRYYLSKNC